MISTSRRTADFWQLPPRGILLVEGIHGLNPALLEPLGRDQLIAIYANGLTSMSIDSTHPFPSCDLRLLRRALRDRRTRGRAFGETLEVWESVQRGEIKHISPQRWNADYYFTSALVFELGPLAAVAIPKVNAVLGSPTASPTAKGIAQRLNSLLSFVRPVTDKNFGPISTIREFIGGSEFGEL
jgi:uridine kinase